MRADRIGSQPRRFAPRAARSAALAVVLAVAALGAPARAQGSGLAFLALDVDPASAAAGSAWSARAEGPFGPLANPAGLAVADGNAAGLAVQDWVGGARTLALAGRFAAGASGGVGLYVAATTSGELEARDQPGAPQGTFEVQYVAVGAGAARRFGPVRLGVAAKALSERAFEASAAGFAVDAGAQADLAGGGVRLGAAVQHLGRMSALDVERTPLPTTVRGGVTVYPFRVVAATADAALLSVGLSAEARYLPRLDDPTRLHVGAEAVLFDLLTVRAGYVGGDPVRRLSAGAGLAVGAFRVDYAALPLESGFGTSHLIGVRYGW